jgi:hypothetical protein
MQPVVFVIASCDMTGWLIQQDPQHMDHMDHKFFAPEAADVSWLN